MINLSKQILLLAGRRQSILELCDGLQGLIRPKNVLGTTSHIFQQMYLPSNSIHKSFKSSESKKVKSVEKPKGDGRKLKRLFSPEEDQILLEHVSSNGKTSKSLKNISQTLDRSIISLQRRCRKLLSENEYDTINNGTRRLFSPEEDRRLREHVRVNGKTKKSLENIAQILERSLYSVQSRCEKLFSTNEYDRSKRARKEWDYTDDGKLVDSIFKLKQINPNNILSIFNVTATEFRAIAPEFERSTIALIKRWRSNIVPSLEPHVELLADSNRLKEDVMKLIAKNFEKNTTNLRGYSEKDVKFIIKQVKVKGDVPETWNLIAKALGKKDAASVKRFYYNHILQTPKVKGAFTPEEDEIIIRHVEEYGRSQKSFTGLTKDLGRVSRHSVELRYKKLLSKNEFEINANPRKWEFEDDTTLINHIFNAKEINANDFLTLENVKLSEFDAIAIELKRSSNSCYYHWMQYIVPTLKTHIKTLPIHHYWKKDVLSYILENKIKHKNELDIDQMLMGIAPGQTSTSLLSYLNELKRTRKNGKLGQSKLPLCDLASKRLMEQRQDDPVFNENHKGEQKRLKCRQDLISYYKTMI